MLPNNTINSDVQKRRFAFLHSGYRSVREDYAEFNQGLLFTMRAMKFKRASQND